MNTLTNTYFGATIAILALGLGIFTFSGEANADKVLVTIEGKSDYTGDYLGVFESTDIGNPGEKCQPNTKEPANCLENKDYGSAPKNLKLGVCIHGEVIVKEACLRDVMNPVQDCDKNTINMPINCAGKKDYKPYCKFRTDDGARDASFKFSFMEESDGNKYLDCSVSGMHRRIE